MQSGLDLMSNVLINSTTYNPPIYQLRGQPVYRHKGREGHQLPLLVLINRIDWRSCRSSNGHAAIVHVQLYRYHPNINGWVAFFLHNLRADFLYICTVSLIPQLDNNNIAIAAIISFLCSTIHQHQRQYQPPLFGHPMSSVQCGAAAAGRGLVVAPLSFCLIVSW